MNFLEVTHLFQWSRVVPDVRQLRGGESLIQIAFIRIAFFTSASSPRLTVATDID